MPSVAEVTVKLENIEPVVGVLKSVGVLLEAIADHGAPKPVREAANEVANRINAMAEED